MATLATQSVTRAGVVPAYAAAAGGGDKFTPDSCTYLHVKNGSGAPINVTIVTPNTVFGDAIADRVVAVGATSEAVIGPFPAQHFANSADSGLAAITYSGVTSLTIGAFRLVQP